MSKYAGVQNATGITCPSPTVCRQRWPGGNCPKELGSEIIRIIVVHSWTNIVLWWPAILSKVTNSILHHVANCRIHCTRTAELIRQGGFASVLVMDDGTQSTAEVLSIWIVDIGFRSLFNLPDTSVVMEKREILCENASKCSKFYEFDNFVYNCFYFGTAVFLSLPHMKVHPNPS